MEQFEHLDEEGVDDEDEDDTDEYLWFSDEEDEEDADLVDQENGPDGGNDGSGGHDRTGADGARKEQKTPGRISDANHRLIKEGFKAAVKLAADVASKTGLTTGQVLDQWSVSRAGKHLKNNMWNAYAKYFKAHTKQELARLTSGRP